MPVLHYIVRYFLMVLNSLSNNIVESLKALCFSFLALPPSIEFLPCKSITIPNGTEITITQKYQDLPYRCL